MAITLAQICDAIESTLGAASTVAVSQSYNELTEGVHDFPLLQVYPEAGSQDPYGGTDRTTMQGGVRQTEFTIHADYYARQRSHIGENMDAVVDGVDALQVILDGQDHQPFGLGSSNVSFRWEWTRALFTYGDPQLSYVGARFIITVRVY